MARQQPLFVDDRPEVGSDSGDLVLHPHPERKLSPAERTFNRRVARVEKLRDSLAGATRRLDDALDYHAKHLRPRLERQTALHKELVRAFEPFLGDKRLKRVRDREALSAIVATQLDRIARAEGGLADPDLRALFERVNGVTADDAEREHMEAARSIIEDMFDDMDIDVDLSGLRPGMSAEELAAAAAQIGDALHRKAGELDGWEDGPNAKGNARERARAERVRQAEVLRKKSVASIYKRLARLVHPDLERDGAERQRKVPLMQRLTAAYRENDLLTLLTMELEWIGGDHGVRGPLPADQLKLYNEVLGEQAADLEQEIADLPFQARYAPLAVEDSPFELRLRTDGPAEAHRLDRTIARMETSLERLRSREALREVRDSIREFRAVTETPFGVFEEWVEAQRPKRRRRRA
jgi:hypothetical protein